eukprot:1692211-Prorocentrum_lima.AAC.1
MAVAAASCGPPRTSLWRFYACTMVWRRWRQGGLRQLSSTAACRRHVERRSASFGKPSGRTRKSARATESWAL